MCIVALDGCSKLYKCISGPSFTKELSKTLGFSFFLSEKLTLFPYQKILSLNLRYFMKLTPIPENCLSFYLIQFSNALES